MAMTEADWLTATGPQPMLAFLARAGASERKFHMFATACCRRVGHLLGGRSLGTAYEVRPVPDGSLPKSGTDALYGDNLACLNLLDGVAWEVAANALSELRRAVRLVSPPADERKEYRAQAVLLRCVFGNPFRPVPSLAPSVLAWDGGTLRKLAAAIYAERAFGRLPILAEALEDAGCTDADVLGHCRGGGEHVRGCWVVDLVLGKE
jgi:hypothetical protein